MKLGLLSAILPELSFEEVIDFACEEKFAAMEIMCWPAGKAERRYAGITHIDVSKLDSEATGHIKNYSTQKNVDIATLGYYPNALDENKEQSEIYIAHIKKVIEAAAKLGVKNVGTFIGRDQYKSTADNLKLFAKVWPDIIKYAEKNNVRVCIENCPMYFSDDEWPNGKNLAHSPEIWREMFKTIKSDAFGLAYDPSHLVWQQMDYIRPVYEFKDKIFYIHLKDAKVYPDKLNECGILAPPLSYHTPKIPGLGDIDWGLFISALYDIRYEGYACIEVEDKAFENTLAERKNAAILSKRYLNQFMM